MHEARAILPEREPLDDHPGALCRIDLERGTVLAANAAAATVLAGADDLPALVGEAHFERLKSLAARGSAWGELTTATGRGRLRLRLRAGPDGRTALVDLDLVHGDGERADLEALLDLISDARWHWSVADDDMRFSGGGVLRSGVGAQAVRASAEEALVLVHDDDRERVLRAMDDYLEGRSPRYRVEYRLRDTRRDEWRWVLNRGRIVERDDDGRPLRLVGLITDITARREREAERQRLEDQLRHVQKLDALGQLTGGIAHDFNNILASVLGYAELGLMQLGEGSEPELSGYLDEVRSAADRGRDLIARLLTFSRGRRETSTGEHRAAAASVEDTIRMLRPMLPATLLVDARIAADAPAFAVEPTQLQQLVLNLVINARDAVGENGHVEVRVAPAGTGDVTCASCGAPAESSRPLVALTVTDDGPGIPEAVRGVVFDPFFSTKEAGRGSGLGLSVVHGIVHEHGGHVTLETGDEGTCLTLLLPATDAEADEAAPVGADRAVAGNGRRVLVIDDELAIGRWMGALLERCDFVVDVYDDPARALARFALTPDLWDLVITDQSMPGLSGVELADELLAHDPELPIVICSGYSAFVESATAEDLGFAAFLEKPVPGRELLACVERVLAASGDTVDAP